VLVITLIDFWAYVACFKYSETLQSLHLSNCTTEHVVNMYAVLHEECSGLFCDNFLPNLNRLCDLRSVLTWSDLSRAHSKMLYLCLNTGWRRIRVAGPKICHSAFALYLAKPIFQLSDKFLIKYQDPTTRCHTTFWNSWSFFHSQLLMIRFFCCTVYCSPSINVRISVMFSYHMLWHFEKANWIANELD